MMSGCYADRLKAAIERKGTPALVGLDPRLDQLPESLLALARQAGGSEREIAARAFEEFCRRIIDVVAPLVPAVKPQAAFFEQWGPEGVFALQRVMTHARRAGLIVLCDAKRGDIGSTAAAYAEAYLAGEDPEAAPFPADALTVNPYLGTDTLTSFVTMCQQRGAGLYVLVRTSNPESASFQNHTDHGETLYEKVGRHVEALAAEFARKAAGNYGCIGAVVGATYPEELQALRSLMPHTPLLIPGYGAQGGNAGDVAAAFDSRGQGALINSSRGINYAILRAPYRDQFSPEQWEQAVEQATIDMITDIAHNTPAGVLRQ